jgi:glucoamylase
MPLVWAHAEYVKLLRSLRDGRVFDMPPQTVQRYLVEKKVSPFTLWRFTYKRTSMPFGKQLRIETMAPALSIGALIIGRQDRMLRPGTRD